MCVCFLTLTLLLLFFYFTILYWFFSANIFASVPESDLEFYVAFSFCFHIPLQYVTVPQFFLVFHSLTILMSTYQLFCRMSLHLTLSDVFLC